MPPQTNKNIRAEQGKLGYNDNVFHHRQRCTIAEINAGVDLLPAVRGYKYRIVDMIMSAVGGNVGATTTVDILGTQSSASVKLMAGATANLLRSALVRAGGTGGTVLADGASFGECDAETKISASKTGAAVTTATHVDFLISYVLVPARSGS